MQHQLDQTPKTLAEVLKASLLFHDADDEAIRFVASVMKPVLYKEGDPIILEGEISDHVYFVMRGSVEIVKYHPEVQQVARIALLRAGSHFSDFSVLNHTNKSASAFAAEDSELYRIDGDAFLKIIEKNPAIGGRLVMNLAGLLSNFAQNSSFEYFEASSIKHSPEIPELLPASMWRKLGVLPLSYHSQILLVAVKDPSQPEFFEHCRATLPNIQVNVVLIGESDFEQTLKKVNWLYSNPPLKSAAHETPVSLPEPTILDCLLKSPYFQRIAPASIEQLSGLVDTVDVQPGELIFKPGDPSDFFYIVLFGRVELGYQTEKNRGWSAVVGREFGEGLSEISLLLDKPHSHLSRATLPTRLVRMKKQTFNQLLASGQFCLNLAKRLSLRLQKSTDGAGLKMFDVSTEVKPGELGHLIPRQIIIQQQVIPLRLVENEVTLGTVNPGNDAIYSIANRYLRGFRINLELITAEQFTAWTAQIPSSEDSLHRDRNSGAKSSGGGAIPELNKLLADGFDRRASDLHIEPTPSGYCVRYRIDGVLTEIGSKIPKEAAEAIVNRIKVVSNLDIGNKQTPQDGQLKLLDGTRQLTARVVTVPTRNGEGAVLRLIRERNSIVPLTMLTPDIRTVGLLRSIAKFKQGLFLVTGPTGSGKTTTLYSLIAELNKVDTKIISIEDPIELEIAGTTQLEIKERTDMTFAKALKSTLRQDPDILVVGEIRDAEAAKVVFDAAMAGHLIISTLHTNNALSVKNRLKELEIPVGTIASGLIGAMAQRLVRAICLKCRVSRPITDDESKLLLARLGPDVTTSVLFEGKGCVFCNNTGYHGRLPIIEIWKNTRAVADLLANDASSETLLAEVRNDNFKTLYEFGLRMAVNGLTTIKEVQRCTAGQS